MRHKDRLDAMRTLAIRVVLFGSGLATFGAENAQKEVPAWLDPIEKVSSHAGDSRAVEAKYGENYCGTSERGRSSGVIEHVTLLECSLGNLLLAQLDHCWGGIDTIGFATAFCDHVRNGLAGTAAAVEDAGLWWKEVEEALHHSLKAGIVSIGVFVPLSKITVELLDRHARTCVK